VCGRFTLTVTPEQLQQAMPGLNVTGERMAPRYNIAPSQPVAVVANDGQMKLDYYVWGLIPSWAKEPSIGNRMINARGETLAEKPSFRSAFRRRRCLIPADGFFEWQQNPGGKSKTPMYIRLKSGQPFAFAGLWENWNAPDGSHILSCTIITTTPNDLMEPIHNRMPVILPASAYTQWLEPGEQNPASLQSLIQPFPADQMTAFAVSTLVNRPENDVAAVIQPA
jgi:putative SOS response-associated peptidase YedK